MRNMLLQNVYMQSISLKIKSEVCLASADGLTSQLTFEGIKEGPGLKNRKNYCRSTL
jgi:hypothetical protein